MMSRSRPCHLRLLQLLSILLAFIWSGSAFARDWELRFEQDRFAIATLEDLAQTGATQYCPEHFRPARLSFDFDLEELGTLSAVTAAPEYFLSAQNDLAQANKNIAVNMQLEVTGCAFRQHFSPQEGRLIVSGELGVGRIPKTQYIYILGGSDNTIGLSYTAHLAGSKHTSRADTGLRWGCCSISPTSIAGRRIMGSLSFGYPRLGWVPLVSGTDRQDVVSLDFSIPRILISSEIEPN